MDDVTQLKFRVGDGPDQQVRGRTAWTLAQLLAAGERGVTPVERPAPRWSGYVDQLRDRYGLAIETIREPHHGIYRGHHGRYVLRSEVEILDIVRRGPDGPVAGRMA